MKPRRSSVKRLLEKTVRFFHIVATLTLNGWNRSRYFKKFKILGAQGHDCYFANRDFGTEPYLVFLGDNVIIASGVRFVTHDFSVVMLRRSDPTLDIETIQPIRVGNNVFLGLDSILLPGTEIRDKVIVAAGSITKGTLESGWVYAGAPARKVKPMEQHIDEMRKRENIWLRYTSGDPKKFLVEAFRKTNRND